MAETTTLGGGCFWCIEAAYKELEGILSVTSGYAGGDTDDPTYREVCNGHTGHAEVVRLEYDPDTISFERILEVFFAIHDPTQLNRQGPDVGSQYRSIILAETSEQRRLAQDFIHATDATFEKDVVTELTDLESFYPAEEYHQNYFEKNPNDAYCQYHAQPKVEKVRKEFQAPPDTA